MIEEEKMNNEDKLNKVLKEMVDNKEFKGILDIQEKLKKSFGKIMQDMLEAEMTEHIRL